MARTQEAMRRLDIMPARSEQTEVSRPRVTEAVRPRVIEITRSVGSASESDKADRDKGAYERITAEIRQEKGVFSQSEYRHKGYKAGTVQSVFSALKNLGIIRPVGPHKGTYVLEQVALDVESREAFLALEQENTRLKETVAELHAKLARVKALV